MPAHDRGRVQRACRGAPVLGSFKAGVVTASHVPWYGVLVLVDDIRLEPRDEQWELSGRISMDRLDTEGQRIWFRFPSEDSTREVVASPFLAALLVTSMWWREQLTIDGPVSARLLTNAREAMELYRCLFPSLH